MYWISWFTASPRSTYMRSLGVVSAPYNLETVNQPIPRIETCVGSKKNRQGISWRYTELSTNSMHTTVRWAGTYNFLMHQASAFKLKFYRLWCTKCNLLWSRAPCPARALFQWLNTRVKVHISVLTIREYPKRHSSYLSDSGDTVLPLYTFPIIPLCFVMLRFVTCLHWWWPANFFDNATILKETTAKIVASVKNMNHTHVSNV